MPIIWVLQLIIIIIIIVITTFWFLVRLIGSSSSFDQTTKSWLINPESTCLSNSLVFITALNSIIGYGCLNEWCQIKYAIQIIWNSYDSFVCFLSPEKLANNTQIVYCIKYSNNDCIIGRDIWENGGNFSLIGEVTLGFRWGFYIPYDTK